MRASTDIRTASLVIAKNVLNFEAMDELLRKHDPKDVVDGMNGMLMIGKVFGYGSECMQEIMEALEEDAKESGMQVTIGETLLACAMSLENGVCSQCGRNPKMLKDLGVIDIEGKDVTIH